MTSKLTRLTQIIAMQLHLVAESCTIFSSPSRRPVRKPLDTPSYIDNWGKQVSFLRISPRWFVPGNERSGLLPEKVRHMEQSPSWEDDSPSSSQEIFRLLWNPNVHFRVHRSSTLVCLCPCHRICSSSEPCDRLLALRLTPKLWPVRDTAYSL
jgi:hypothetical protein